MQLEFHSGIDFLESEVNSSGLKKSGGVLSLQKTMLDPIFIRSSIFTF